MVQAAINEKNPIIIKILTAAALSLLFEVLQYIFAIGRSNITDIINNTLGALIGMVTYKFITKIFKEKTIQIINILSIITIICFIELLIVLIPLIKK